MFTIVKSAWPRENCHHLGKSHGEAEACGVQVVPGSGADAGGRISEQPPTLTHPPPMLGSDPDCGRQ